MTDLRAKDQYLSLQQQRHVWPLVHQWQATHIPRHHQGSRAHRFKRRFEADDSEADEAAHDDVRRILMGSLVMLLFWRPKVTVTSRSIG